MLSQVHQHITSELNQSARTDTVFLVTAVVFNLVVLGINSGVASSGEEASSLQNDLVLGTLIVLALLVNALSIVALLVGRRTRAKLLQGLLAMYKDNEVDKYYDASLLGNYNTRYSLFTGVLLCLAATAIVVPLIIRIL